ncbi:hypothetical protein PoB_001081400 [Plakobranchus ocellatus]|uniref:Uncharacterized protein n=1 Tax=Plakobranchus ocellatus TaxID=259542 RepID=A0AAV3YQH4_9GAST|nr:hypothetical protein PoB_001081400 [Plakobranchus ocellatus]
MSEQNGDRLNTAGITAPSSEYRQASCRLLTSCIIGIQLKHDCKTDEDQIIPTLNGDKVQEYRKDNRPTKIMEATGNRPGTASVDLCHTSKRQVPKRFAYSQTWAPARPLAVGSGNTV